MPKAKSYGDFQSTSHNFFLIATLSCSRHRSSDVGLGSKAPIKDDFNLLLCISRAFSTWVAPGYYYFFASVIKICWYVLMPLLMISQDHQCVRDALSAVFLASMFTMQIFMLPFLPQLSVLILLSTKKGTCQSYIV